MSVLPITGIVKELPPIKVIKPLPDKPKKPPKRCEEKDCKKKLFLSDLICRCKKFHCMKHRLPELHNCTYNFKDTAETVKKNVEILVCKPTKILKI